MSLIDLSHEYLNGMPQSRALKTPLTLEYLSIDGGHEPDGLVKFTRVTLMSHIGTHMDAPSHFLKDGPTISDLPLDRCTGTGVILHLPRETHQPVSAADLEAAKPEVRPGDIVFVRTGWGALFTESTASAYVKHPYYQPDVADWLVDRNVKIFGTDTMTPDPPHRLRPPGYAMDMHVKLLSNGTLIIENLNLEGAASGRYRISAFPVNLHGADGSPVRVVAEPEEPDD